MTPREALAWLDEHREKHADSLLREGDDAIERIARVLDAFDVLASIVPDEEVVNALAFVPREPIGPTWETAIWRFDAPVLCWRREEMP